MSSDILMRIGVNNCCAFTVRCSFVPSVVMSYSGCLASVIVACSRNCDPASYEMYSPIFLGVVLISLVLYSLRWLTIACIFTVMG